MADEPTDDEIVAVITEHLVNLYGALVGAGITPDRCLRLTSKTLIDLDRASNERPPSLTPVHDQADAALDALTAALSILKVKTPERIEGYPLTEMFGQFLGAARQAVEDHRQFSLRGPVSQLVVIQGDKHD